MMKGIKTIIFDLGGVLMDLNKQRCINAFKHLGFTDIQEYLGEYEQKGMFMDLEDGTISAPEFRDKIRNHIGKPVTDQQIDDAFNLFLVGIPDYKLTMLLELRKKYQVFMLSNTNPVMFEGRIPELFKMQGGSISDYFDKFYLSYQLGATKPKPIVFEKIIADAKILPEETLFLDDSRRNIEAARTLGFKIYLTAPQEDFTSIFKQ
ncbi:HAD family hydrolase [Coprobacter sp.]